jgi:chloride channel protein, CIC family
VLLGKRFTALNVVALFVGALAGLAAVVLRWSIDYVQNASFSGEFDLDAATSLEENQYIVPQWVGVLGLVVVLVPMAGGVAVGLIRHFWPQTRQYGVTEVMAAVQARGGIVKGRSAVGHGLLSAITVGTGGSTGREGPIGYIGAALGSSLGRRLRFTARDIKVLLGCGFSAGIAASFNAPMGGVLMALELVLPEFSTHAFIPLVLATVVGVVIGQAFLGDHATFIVPGFDFSDWRQLLLYFVLGILCGAVAVGFIRLLSWSYRSWADLRMPEILKPALGGLLVGAIGYTMFVALPIHQYHVFGTGYATVSDILGRSPAGYDTGLLLTLAVLAVAKPIATTITVGSGGGGGMFSVSLYQGAILGGLFGFGAHLLWPDIATDPAMFALVGMGAFYAASSRATLTAIVFLAEITQEFSILLPVMLAAVTADAIAVRFSRDSLYTIKLTQRGIRYEHDRLTSPLDYLLVKDVMTPKVDVVPATMTVGEAFNRMLDLGHTGYPVVDEHGKLAGMVTRRDMSKHMQAGRGPDPLSAVVPGLCITAFPEEPLYKARDRIHQQGIGRLVVVDPADRRKVVGILTRSDLLRAEAEKDVEHEEEWSQ